MGKSKTNKPQAIPVTLHMLDNTTVIRSVTIESDKHIVATDLAEPLGFNIQNLHYHLSKHIAPIDKQLVKLQGGAGAGHYVLTKAGVRKLVEQSRIDKAPLLDWLETNIFNQSNEQAIVKPMAVLEPRMQPVALPVTLGDALRLAASQADEIDRLNKVVNQLQQQC